MTADRRPTREDAVAMSSKQDRLECPSCGSPDVDIKARECRACKIGLPAGSHIYRLAVGGATTSRRSNQGAGRPKPLFHSSGQDQP